MFERWRQENFFKYVREEYLIDALADYQVEPDDPNRSVPNPARKAVEKELRQSRAQLASYAQVCINDSRFALSSSSPGWLPRRRKRNSAPRLPRPSSS